MTDRKNIQPKEHQIVTIQHHILSEQRKRFPQATGAFSWLLSAITLATKMTQAKVARAGLLDVIGAVGRENVQGEEQQKLDVYANNALIHCLGVRENVAIIARGTPSTEPEVRAEPAGTLLRDFYNLYEIPVSGDAAR